MSQTSGPSPASEPRQMTEPELPPPDPCPHLPLADIPRDPDDPFVNGPEPPPGKVWNQFPWNGLFIADPFWYDSTGCDIIIQKRIFMLPDEDDQMKATLEVVDAFPKRGLDVLFKAAIRGKPQIVRALLDHGVKPHPVEEDGDDDSLVPLHAAAFHGNLECVKILVEQGNVSPDLMDISSTPFQRAAMAGHLDVVKYILGTGKVDVGRVFVNDGEERHPLEWIVRSGSAEVANYLIDALHDSLSPDAIASSVPDAAIIAAAGWKHIDILKRLLDLRGLVSQVDGGGETEGTAALDNSQEELVMQGLKESIHFAKVDNARLLVSLVPHQSLSALAQTEDYKKEFEEGLLEAVEFNRSETFDFLAAEMFRDDSQSPEAQATLRKSFFYAVTISSLPMIKHIVEKYGVDVNDASSNKQLLTPLAGAAAIGNEDIVRYLLDEAPVRADLSVGAGSDKVLRPLWYAVMKMQKPIIRLLLQRGAVIHLDPRVERGDDATSELWIAACLGPERQVRIYPDRSTWVPGEVWAHVGEEDEDIRAIVFSHVSEKVEQLK